nr:hypothetical protein [uncultured Butyrivibrio sp.]
MGSALKHTHGNTGYFIRYYWKRILIALMMVLVLFGGIAFADTWDDKAEAEGETLLSISYGFINDILNPKVLTETGELLEIGYDGSEISVGPYTSSGAGAILDSIFKVSCVVAVIVLCISFLTDLAMMRQNDITEENVIRKLFMFVVGYLLIANSMKICIAIADTGTWVTQHVTASVTMDVNNSADEIKENMWTESHTTETLEASGQRVKWYEKLGNSVGDFGTKMGFIVQLIFPSLAMKLAWVIASVVCFSRAIELFLMSAFSPLAFMDSNTMDSLTNSPAWRFLKNILAISIQGAVITGTIAIASSMMGSIVNASSSSMGEFMEQSIQIIMIIFAEVSLIVRSQGIAKSVLAIG